MNKNYPTPPDANNDHLAKHSHMPDNRHHGYRAPVQPVESYGEHYYPEADPYQSEFTSAPRFSGLPGGQQEYNQQGQEPSILDTEREVSDMLSKNLSSNSRMNFIRKVYGILFTQLFITAVWIGIVAMNQGYFINFLSNRIELFVLAIIGYIISLYALGCYRQVARSVPGNYILLGIFTCSFAYISGFVTVQYHPEDIMIAGSMTAAMTLGLTLYAITTKQDFSSFFAFMWSLVISLFVAVIMAVVFRNRLVQILVSILMIVLMSVYIIFDTQLIVGGRDAELSIDDYVFAAMMLYIDINRRYS